MDVAVHRFWFELSLAAFQSRCRLTRQIQLGRELGGLPNILPELDDEALRLRSTSYVCMLLARITNNEDASAGLPVFKDLLHRLVEETRVDDYQSRFGVSCRCAQRCR